MAVFDWKVKAIIFGLFSRTDGLTDTNKIVIPTETEPKGQLQRFNENLAAEWDSELMPAIHNLLDNTFIPATAYDRFIPYLEELFGIPTLSQDIDLRRRILKNVLPMYKVKGTLRSYKILFRLLGFDDVEIEEIEMKDGWDNPLFRFDSESRTFDSRAECYPCSYYNLMLTGTMQLTREMYDFVKEVVGIVEPINAKLYNIYYNGKPLLFDIYISQFGDEIYVPYRGDIDFKLEDNGDLHIMGDVPFNVEIIDNGDLIYPIIE